MTCWETYNSRKSSDREDENKDNTTKYNTTNPNNNKNYPGAVQLPLTRVIRKPEEFILLYLTALKHHCSSVSNSVPSSKVPCVDLHASLRSFRPPTSPFGQPSQTEYSAVSSQHLRHSGFLSCRPKGLVRTA